MADSPWSHAPGSGASSNHAAVHAHFSPKPEAADTDDMRDGDSDEGSTVPVPPQTTVPASAATMAGRGSGTP